LTGSPLDSHDSDLLYDDPDFGLVDPAKNHDNSAMHTKSQSDSNGQKPEIIKPCVTTLVLIF